MILVTGGTGHIGNVLVRYLLEQNECIRVLVLPGEDCSPLDQLNIQMVRGDVLERESLEKAFQGVQTVYHLAGMISILPGKNHQVQRVNVEGTLNVLHAARQAGVERLIYTSSIHALHRVPHGITIDERIPFDPENAISAYDQSKAVATLAVGKAIQDGLDGVIICPTGVIGPYDYRRSEMGQLILDSMQDRPQLYVDGAYDFVDVRDVARGMIQAAQGGRRGEHYLLSGERVSVEWLICTVKRIAGLPSRLLKIPMGLARFAANFTPPYYRLTRTCPRFTHYALETVTSNSEISNAKARRELGYAPRPLSDTLADTVRWFQENLPAVISQ